MPVAHVEFTSSEGCASVQLTQNSVHTCMRGGEPRATYVQVLTVDILISIAVHASSGEIGGPGHTAQ
jgi:hypothetical protein